MGKKALFIVIIILVGGVAVGFLSTNRTQNLNPTFSAAPGIVHFAPSLSSNPGSIDNTYGLGQAVSSTSVITAATTVMATTTITSATQDGTNIVNPNPAKAGITPFQTNSSSSFIEFFSNVTIQVSSVQLSLNKAMAIAYTYGGYVAFSSYNNYSSVAILRVPASAYQTALGQVEQLGTLTGFQTNSNDVSVQYTDLNATLASLLSEQASLLNLENRSTSLNSTLIIENELQGVNAQINEIQSQILQTRTLIDYSTITVTLNQETAVTKPLTLKLIATPQSGTAPLAVTFNTLISGGTGQYIVNYNFGDGTSYQGQTLIHTFNQAGTFNVTVSATDSNGTVRETSIVIHVSSPPSHSFRSFYNYVGSLLLAVVEGIVEVAVVVLPIVFVVGLVILPFRNRFRGKKSPTV